MAIDHIILAINDLDAGIQQFTALTGVVAERGGEHPGRGTQNALASLGDDRYLEIMAPLPGASVPAPIPFERLTPAGWALGVTDLSAVMARIEAAGFEAVGPVAGSRRRPDGSVLTWQTATLVGDGFELAPFLIEWDDGVTHPSETSPVGCRLEGVSLFDPEPEHLRRLFVALGYRPDLRPGERGMRATLEGLDGRVTFEPGAGHPWWFSGR
jgi:hypothetical protein